MSGAKGLERQVISRGWPLSRFKDNAKLFWHLCDICAQFGRCEVQNSSMVPQGHLHHTPIVARGKIYPRAVRNGSLRREGAAEAAFRGLGSRSAFSKTSCFRQTSSSVNGDDHRTSQRSGGRDLRRFRDREFERTAAPRTSSNSPRSVRAAPQDVPRGSRGAAASAYEN